ncbi:GAF domain-containing sensor histidine kinase [Actinomadura sp. HBU206391]|uniref:GAF domain-containing sensor histidine kinase n=1 Tax=Actinomadura sp. HBU206391 TaxID=2731692 RepID=UPI00164F7ADD|nr:GAF domain-containing sensor histidine kinase [Actinomadura sp. HBU206391]MBC6460123.1 GAF domain-containing sensor histidine kinase [Actinomadura sp. HBU206391]
MGAVTRRVVIAGSVLVIVFSPISVALLISITKPKEAVGLVKRYPLGGFEQGVAMADQGAVVAAAGWATAVLLGAVVASVFFSGIIAGCLIREAGRPVRRALGMVDRSADGEPSAGADEAAVGETSELRRALNAMSASLECRDDQLGALRRVATVVAHGAPPFVVCNTVTQELCRILDIDGARMLRFEPDGSVTVVAFCSNLGDPCTAEMPVGSRWDIEGHNVLALVARTGKPARIDDFTGAPGPLAAFLRKHGVRSAIGAPIIVDNHLWGVMVGFSTRREPLTGNAEARICEYTELIAAVIANAQARCELTASRARLVAAADQTRKRIERDLHDGIQQQLVSLALNLRAAEADLPEGQPQLRARLSAVQSGLGSALTDLQDISRGIHPAILAQGGLGPAIKTLGRRSAVPVELDLHLDLRLGEAIEVTAYYVIAEALANAAKYAKASVVHIHAEARDDGLHLLVRDDGVGGADPVRGSGLTGLIDRVEVMGGTIEVRSPLHHGTTLQIALPCSPEHELGADSARFVASVGRAVH